MTNKPLSEAQEADYIEKILEVDRLRARLEEAKLETRLEQGKNIARLRDRFAMAALVVVGPGEDSRKLIAERAYLLADAMLKAREAKP